MGLICVSTSKANFAESSGGGLFITGHSTSPRFVNGCHFLANKVLDAYGGGVAIESKAVPTFSDVRIENNVAVRGGGGVMIRDTSTFAHFSRSVISHNSVSQAGGNGGGVFILTGAGSIFNNVSVHNNVASGYGGGVAITDRGATPPTFNDCYIDDNTARSWYGGGVLVQLGAAANFTNTFFRRNLASFSGAGVFISDADTNPMFKNCTISNNQVILTSTDECDALRRVIYMPPWTRTRRERALNYDTTSITAINDYKHLPVATRCNVNVNTKNEGGLGGGGVAVTSGAQPRFSDTWIMANAAPHFAGGLLIMDSNTNPVLERCVIRGNLASGLGGGAAGIYVGGSASPVLTDTSITGNSAGGYAGGYFSNENVCSEPSLTNVVIRDNIQLLSDDPLCDCTLDSSTDNFNCVVYVAPNLLDSVDWVPILCSILGAICCFLCCLVWHKQYTDYQNWNIVEGKNTTHGAFDDFGYGLIDYTKELRFREKLGEGNFGEVYINSRCWLIPLTLTIIAGS